MTAQQERVTELDKRLNTRQAAAFLTASGYATAPATLNKLRCIGGGPAFEKFGRRPLYSQSSLLQWVQSRTSHPLRSTSDVNDTAHPKRFSRCSCVSPRCWRAIGLAPCRIPDRSSRYAVKTMPMRYIADLTPSSDTTAPPSPILLIYMSSPWPDGTLC